MAKGQKKRKGFFSDLRLPVVKNYIYPSSRSSLLVIGGIGAALVAVVFVFNLTAQSGSLVSNGPLSSNHASFGGECASCHTAFESVTNDKCSLCHEKFGDEIGAYTYSSHYLYRSGDFTRLVPSPDEVTCFSCHPEHQGSRASIIQVPDAACTQCHEYGSFNSGHPEFAFAAENIEDPANLNFSHTQHVTEVINQEGLADIERSCLYCHHADQDGKSFQPIEFETACSACHISTSVSTSWLPIRSASRPAGVQTLSAIQTRQGPGTRWADAMNPSEFQQRRDEVRKRPVYHRDPWILENLKRLQDELYPDRNDLAELLRAAAGEDERDARDLYTEALTTLETYADELRSTPGRDVQKALSEIDGLIALVKRRLRDPYRSIDETRFLLGPDDINSDLNASEIAEFESVIDGLTETCQTCHTVQQSAIQRVQKDQRILFRSEFDHRVHIIQRGCLECHSAIPIREHVARDSVAIEAIDYAGIQNLPAIETCQTCHAPAKAVNTCISCHLFHPDKSQHTNMLRYLE
ncbi:MAG: hypothetical protein E2O85_05475 [Bacteroidetes bacterium]|nr:MAG: hypothetical protein E2O85_05475 [Bacteroidota bacterium]